MANRADASENRRIRVLWLIKCLATGGAERLLVSMARVIDHDRFDIEVAVLLHAEEDFLFRELEALGVVVHRLDAGTEVDPRWALRLRRLLLHRRYDLVHNHSPYVAGIARLVTRSLSRRKRPSLIYTEHSVWGAYGGLTRLLNAGTYGLDQHRFAVSSAVQDSIGTKRRGGTELLVQGLVLSDFVDLPPGRSIRTELGIRPDETVLLIVAGLRTAKDYPRLLRAVAGVRGQGLSTRLLAAGSGPLLAELEGLRDVLGLEDCVHFLGDRQDVVSLFCEADIFVLSSKFEGMPVSLMEAMASGLPIVAPAVGGIPDVVRHGVDGVLVTNGSDGALAEALAELINDPRRRLEMGRAAQRRSAMFDITRPTRRVEEVYVSLARSAWME